MDKKIVMDVQGGCVRGLYAGEEMIPRGLENGYKLEQYVHGPTIIDDRGNEEHNPGLTREEVNDVLRKETGRAFDEETFKKLESLEEKTVTISRNGIEFRNHPDYKIMEADSGREVSVDKAVELTSLNEETGERVVSPEKLFGVQTAEEAVDSLEGNEHITPDKIPEDQKVQEARERLAEEFKEYASNASSKAAFTR